MIPTDRLAISEILPAGQRSRPETLRGRALAVAESTITDQALIDWFVEERARQVVTTRENYRTQLRRLQCFALEEIKTRSVRFLQREDWDRLVSFLTNPPDRYLPPPAEYDPATDSTRRRRGANPAGLQPVGTADIEWRPFKRVLKPASVAQALTVIGNFYKWMSMDGVEAIHRSPFGGIKIDRPRVGQTAEARGVSHYLAKEQWAYVLRAIDNMPTGTPAARRAQARASWVFTLLVETGLRASEVAAARSSMLKPSSQGGWHLEIIRKGNVRSKTVIPATTLREWANYRNRCGLTGGQPGAGDDLPLVSQARTGHMNKPMTRQSVWTIIKDTCALAAALAKEEGADAAAALLALCSPHWLRHTFGTWLIDSGADIRSAKSLLEHASVATTSIYIHTDAQTQRAALDRMTAGVPRRVPGSL